MTRFVVVVQAHLHHGILGKRTLNDQGRKESSDGNFHRLLYVRCFLASLNFVCSTYRFFLSKSKILPKHHQLKIDFSGLVSETRNVFVEFDGGTFPFFLLGKFLRAWPVASHETGSSLTRARQACWMNAHWTRIDDRGRWISDFFSNLPHKLNRIL